MMGNNNTNAITTIAPGTFFEGRFEAGGTMVINGALKGEIESKGRVAIGPTGHVEAMVSAVSIEISGELVGNVRVMEELIINPTGRFKGNILHKDANLIIIKGGRFMGKSLEFDEDTGESVYHDGPIDVENRIPINISQSS